MTWRQQLEVEPIMRLISAASCTHKYPVVDLNNFLAVNIWKFNWLFVAQTSVFLQMFQSVRHTLRKFCWQTDALQMFCRLIIVNSPSLLEVCWKLTTFTQTFYMYYHDYHDLWTHFFTFSYFLGWNFSVMCDYSTKFFVYFSFYIWYMWFMGLSLKSQVKLSTGFY